MSHHSPIKLGVLHLAFMSVAGVFTLRTLPLMAEYGFSAVFYYIVAAILYFIPCSLMCAELATGWPKTGGLYIWVREALGPRMGFLAIWFEWTNTVISFPATLAFITATLAYAINPQLADNKIYMVSLMLIVFWSTTFLNFLGIKFSSWISGLGLILGTLLPFLLILALSASWILMGKPIRIQFHWHTFIPNFHLTNSSFLVGLLLGYAGMQIAAFHAQETKNPQKDFPRAILFAVIIILLLSIFGSLAISIVIPQSNISVLTGLMQASQAFFNSFHMRWFLPIVAILTAIGTLAMLNLWVIGPCKGLLATAQYGDLPIFLQKINRYGAPTTLLILQAVVGTLFSLVYLLMPTVSSSYWILVDLTALLTLLMNIIMFISLISLRYSQPLVHRAYKIPGGNIGVWIVGGIGIFVCASVFFLGFMPPEQLKMGSTLFYEGFLIGGIILISLIPFLILWLEKKLSCNSAIVSHTVPAEVALPNAVIDLE